MSLLYVKYLLFLYLIYTAARSVHVGTTCSNARTYIRTHTFNARQCLRCDVNYPAEGYGIKYEGSFLEKSQSGCVQNCCHFVCLHHFWA